MIPGSRSEKETLGQELRRLREQRGWTLEAAAQITKIKAEQLHDLEADNYDNFPSVAYVRGFVRIYARALGLDDRKVLAKLEGRFDEEEDFASLPPLEAMPPVTKVRQPVMRRIGSQIIGLTVIAIIVGIVFVLWRIGNNFKSYPTGPQVAEVPRALPVRKESELTSESAPKKKAKKKIVSSNIPRAEVITPKPQEPVIPKAEVITPAEPIVKPATTVVEEVVAEREVGPINETNQLEAPRAEVVQPAISLQLKATEEVWLRVIMNGNEAHPAYDGIMAPGQSGSWQGQRFYIVARPASALWLTIDGQSRGQLSQSSTRQEFTFP